MALFLVWHDEDGAIEPERLAALDRFELRPGLILVDSELSLSPLYHRIKWALPGRAAGRLPDWRGSTTWFSTIPRNGGGVPLV